MKNADAISELLNIVLLTEDIDKTELYLNNMLIVIVFMLYID